MAAILQTSGRCIEGYGPEALPLVAERLLHDHDTERRFDMGIVRGLLNADGIRRIRQVDLGNPLEHRDDPVWRKLLMEEALEASTGEAVPATCTVVESFWEQAGLTDILQLELRPGLHFDRTIAKPTRTHIDALPTYLDDITYPHQTINGPLSFSVRLDTLPKPRIFYARRLNAKHEPTIDDRRHNAQAYRNLTDRVARWHAVSEFWFTRAAQGTGDAIVFPAHPWPSMHATKRVHGTLTALFDFQLQRP